MTEHADLRKLLTPAAHAVQLHYATPHALIAHDAVLRLLPRCADNARDAILARHRRYVKRSPVLTRPAAAIIAEGQPDADTDVDGMLDSLAEHKVFNALFYALRLVAAGEIDRFERACLRLAARDVDRLGHVFIYTDAVLRLIAESD
jgi:hypothetical protein